MTNDVGGETREAGNRRNNLPPGANPYQTIQSLLRNRTYWPCRPRLSFPAVKQRRLNLAKRQNLPLPRKDSASGWRRNLYHSKHQAAGTATAAATARLSQLVRPCASDAYC